MIEKEAVNMIMGLFKPVNNSIDLLQKIDKKLDTQASSKLYGQLETLRLSLEERDQELFKTCLGNLNESIEYYRRLTDQTMEEYEEIYSKHKVKFHLTSIPKGWRKFGRKAGQKPVLCLARIFDYACLWCLSEAGAIICLISLQYSSQVIEERELRLAIAFYNVLGFIIGEAYEELGTMIETSRLYKPLADNIGILPDNWMESATFPEHLGAKGLTWILGKDAMSAVISGYTNFKAILMALMPDRERFPDVHIRSLMALKYDDPMIYRGCVNKNFENEIKNRWRFFLTTSKQR